MRVDAIADYRTLVFDCDGVILDSNRLKTEAFRAAALPHGAAAAERLVAYHVANGGISRHVKFRHFLAEILGLEATEARLAPLLDSYAAHVRAGLATCAVTPGLDRLRAATPGIPWAIVSGGDQDELRAVFRARGLDGHFDAGIFGSPEDKDSILAREIAAGRFPRPGLFLGDSRLDQEAAARQGLDFVFVHGWTEMAGWEAHMAARALPVIARVADLLEDCR